MSAEKICPVCGELNHCLMAENDAYQEHKKCWCFQEKNTLERSVFATMTDDDQKHCICQKCWEKYSQKN